MANRDVRRLRAWLFISLAIHLGVFYLVSGLSEDTEVSQSKPTEVEIVELHEDPRKKQIVDIPEWGNFEKPKHARFLSRHNQRVDKETKAPRQPPRPWQNAIRQGNVGPKTGEKSHKKNGELPVLGKEALQLGSPAETDYLPDVALGEKTYLNAEAFKHTSYYLEIKRKIELAWNPMGALRALTGRGISIERGLLATYLGITLTEDGSLERMVVLKSSGVPGLDREAERAFRVSSPFTKVPQELLTSDNKLRFEFGFIVGG